jgi:hypothetical protein
MMNRHACGVANPIPCGVRKFNRLQIVRFRGRPSLRTPQARAGEAPRLAAVRAARSRDCRRAARTAGASSQAGQDQLDGDDPGWELHGLGAEAEEYELAVDLETGILLRVEARFDGEPFLIGEAQAVAFDEELPPSIFAFTPPEGKEVQQLDFDRPRFNQTIYEAASEAPFTVFILPSIPDQ